MANRLYRVAPDLYERFCAMRKEAGKAVRVDLLVVNQLHGKIVDLRERYPALQLNKSSQEG